jgi:multiple sugar transport system ATP-binding protein
VRQGAIRDRVGRAASLLGLDEVLAKKPRTLSGGQRQRVAMGRSIVREPQAFLMDEPLSNLDAKLRVQMRAEIARLQRDLGVTTIYVTHDQVEAMTMGDRVAVMSKGVLQQVDRPQVLYDRPLNLFVAEFIGSPAMNLVEAELERANGAVSVTLGSHRLRVDDEVVGKRPALEGFEGKGVVVGIRPEDLEDSAVAGEAPDEHRLSANVDIREDMGSEVFLHFTIDAIPVRSEVVKEAVGAEAVEATEALAQKEGAPFIARVDRETRAREGSKVDLVVATKRLHFFDPETGEGIYD